MISIVAEMAWHNVTRCGPPCSGWAARRLSTAVAPVSAGRELGLNDRWDSSQAGVATTAVMTTARLNPWR